MRRRTLTVRTIALLGAGSAAIHQLRYAIGYGDGATRELAAHPHGYLEAALPGIATALVISIAALALRAAGAGSRSNRPAQPARRSSLVQLWLACAFVLAAIYGIQETAEGAGAVLGGGWIGMALAVPAGLLVALAIRGSDAAEALRLRAPLIAFSLASTRAALTAAASHGRAALRRLGARGPPLAFVV